MRSGGCDVQQALGPDAAAVMVQAVSAARRRGHVQVTPLHVASALLAAGEGGVLRAACLRSRPAGAAHPLRCKALEMCLNVALNRLATTPIAAAGAPAHHAALFGFQHQHQHHNVPPALSNALAAAFKRAQASQRRGGSSEQQAAAAAAAAASNSNRKVELEQLVISILDDPSVNRVLREAGFSSAEVKAHVAVVDKPAATAVSSSPDHNYSSNTVTTTTTCGASPPPPNPSSNAKSDPVIIKATTNKPEDDLSRGKREDRTTTWHAAGQPSLGAAVLGMHPVSGGLTLNLVGDSELTYAGTDMVAAAPARSVPSWFRRCHGPFPALSRSELALSFSSPPPAAASSIVYGGGFPHYDYHNHLFDPRQLWHINHRHDINAPIMAESHDDHPWPASPNNPCSSNSASVSSAAGTTRRGPKRFTELTAENLRVLCGALEARVPRHRDLAPGIASAVLRRRSGVTARTAARPTSSAATWLVFEGGDTDGKEAVARELARLVFGSYDDFTTVGVEFTIEPARSAGYSSGGGELSLKKRRSSSPEKEELLGSLLQRLHEAVRENPRRVFLIDGVIARSGEEAGILMNAVATGTARGYNNGDVASLEDAIVVLSCEPFHQSCWSRAPSSRTRLKKTRDDDIGSSRVDEDDGAQKAAKRPRFSLDLNACAVDGDELEEGSSSSLDGGAEILNNAVDGVFLFQC